MDETIAPQEGMNPEPEVVEETVEEGTTETPAPHKTYSEIQWNELHGRAKKAEADLKALKSSKPTDATVPAPSQSIEETVLLAQGMPEELLAQLKKVAQVQGIGLIKAQSDPIFVAVKERLEKEQKQKDASLPASRGSGGVKATKDFSTPNLSEEEHRRMFNEKVN